MENFILYLLKLIAFLEFSPIKTRYLLIELANEQEIEVSVRSDFSCIPGKKTYECKNEPEIDTFATNLQSILTCAKDKKDVCKGNYIIYEVNNEGNQNVLQLKDINAEKCKPKPKGCHCKAMLDKLLQRYKNVNLINGYFMGNSFIKACKCFLGSAARFGFRFVDFSAAGCSGKTKFADVDHDDHDSICEAVEQKKCKWEEVEIAKVTKN